MTSPAPAERLRRGVSDSTRPADSESTSAYQPTAWHNDYRFGIGAIIAATVITVLIGVLGPSAIAVSLGPRDNSLLPPWYVPALAVPPNEWVVTLLAWFLLILGATGLLVTLRALRAGWRPRPRRLIVLGASLSGVTALIPPLTSADVLMYAAYGRLERLGLNPYQISPARIFRTQFDVVITRTERPWEDTQSVYGPAMTWLQLVANYLGGENLHDIVFWLQVFHVLAFVGASLVAIQLARGDTDRVNRAIMLTLANPLMIWAVIAGAHNEALSVLFAIIGMTMMRRSAFAAGIGIGLAGCFKLSIGLWGLAMLWAYRRQPKKAALLCLGTAVPMGLGYGWWRPEAFTSVLRNGTYISSGSWASLFDRILNGLGVQPSLLITGVVAYALLVALVVLLSRLLPWTPVPGIAAGVDPQRDELTVAMRTALILSVAWLVSAMYTLSWYDLMAFVPMAVLASSRLDTIMIVRNVFLALSFVPGRALEYGPGIESVSIAIRDYVSPVVQWGVIAAIIVWFVRQRRMMRSAKTPTVDSRAGEAVR